MNDIQRDRLLAVLTAVGATAYVAVARGIEDSLLSDAVGAGGVPQGVGLAMGLACVLLWVRTLGKGKAGPEPLEPPPPSRGRAGVGVIGGEGHIPPPSQPSPWEGEGVRPPTESAVPQIARTAALVLILLAYSALLPWLGYTLSICLLVLASGWLAGAAFKPPLWACAALSGPLLWALFDRLLQVRMPVGLIWG